MFAIPSTIYAKGITLNKGTLKANTFNLGFQGAQENSEL